MSLANTYKSAGKCIAISALGLLIGCVSIQQIAANKHIKKGDSYYENEKYEEAIVEYYNALTVASTYEQAFIRLQRSLHLYINNNLNIYDQKVRDRKYIEANNLFNNIQRTVSRYSPSKFIENNINAYDNTLSIEIPETYQNKHNGVLRVIASQHIHYGTKQLEENNYQAAIRYFEEAKKFNKDHPNLDVIIKHTKEKLRNAEAEKHYLNGINNYNSGNYRAAYWDFNRALEQINGYKDSVERRSRAREKARINIGVFDFDNNTSFFNAHSILYGHLVNNLVNRRSAFATLVDRQNINRVLSEIRLSQHGQIDISSATKAGELLGLQYMVMGRIISIMTEGGNLNTTMQSAYYVYHPASSSDGCGMVQFPIYQGESKVNIEVQYQIIEVKTGRITRSNIVRSNLSDEVFYAQFQGNTQGLYLGDICKLVGESTLAFGVAHSVSQVNQDIFTTPKNLKTIDQLIAEGMTNIANQISNDVIRTLY